MRKLLVLISLFLLIAVPAFGANLVGSWDFELECLEIGSNNIPADPVSVSIETGILVINSQQNTTVSNGTLFKGQIRGVTPSPPAPNSILFGTLIGKEVTFTQWDAIVKGRLKGKKTIHFISQHALDDSPVAPGTCIGKLKKISKTPQCP